MVDLGSDTTELFRCGVPGSGIGLILRLFSLSERFLCLENCSLCSISVVFSKCVVVLPKSTLSLRDEIFNFCCPPRFV